MAVHAYSTPSRAPAPLTTRARLEAAVEAAIAALDALDGDPDLEDFGDREPSLGWTEREAQTVDNGSAFIGRAPAVGSLFEFGGTTYDAELA